MTATLKAHPIAIDSPSALGIVIYMQRGRLKMSRQEVADLAGLDTAAVSQLERGDAGKAHFRVVLRTVNALGMDIELRSRNWTPTGPVPLDFATSVTDIGLGADALACLQAAGIETIGELGGAGQLLQLSEFSNGTELYEIVCALNRHGLSLPSTRHRRRLPGDREREMFRLRVVEGLTLSEVAERIGGIQSERVRQLLNFYFRLTGTPPAVKTRKSLLRRSDTQKPRKPRHHKSS